MFMKPKVLARGAEAIIIKTGNKIVKDRIPKSYRHPEIDNKLRKRRTKSESKLITKASSIIPSPQIFTPDNKSSKKTQHDNYKITMKYVPGKRLSDSLDSLKNKYEICKQIGCNIALIHDAGIIHGDLTTSNMILAPEPAASIKSTTSNKPYKHPSSKNHKHNYVFFIDFGLGFHSDRIEDKAVDLHLISQALEAKHHKIFKKAFESVLQGYKKSKNYSKTLRQLEKVEKRGRYKQQY